MAETHPAPAASRPGAMTSAMKSAAPAHGPRVLRIGVIQHGAVVEERILRERAPVTIGSTESNTFTVLGEGVPARFEVFSLSNAQYRLRFTDAMEGRVATPDGLRSLRELSAAGRAVRAGDVWELLLDEGFRGKVTLAGVSLLFQFVAPPPMQPRPQLPMAIRNGLGRNVDWAYNACLSGFLALAMGGLGYLEYGYDPQVEDNFTLDVRLVQIAMPAHIPEPAPSAPSTPEHPPDNQASSTPANQPEHRPTDHRAEHATREESPRNGAPRSAPRPDSSAQAELSADRAAQAAERAMTGGPRFDALTGLLDQNRGTRPDMLSNGNPMTGTLAAMGRMGVTNTPQQGISRPTMSARAGGPEGSLGHGTRADTGGPAITTGPIVTRERTLGPLRAEPSAPRINGGDGVCRMPEIAATMRREVGGIRACYESAIRRNPGLAGRIELSFSIGTSGRVLGSPEASGMSQDPQFIQCVENRVRYITFPQSEGGTCEVTFPFRFDHSE